jgi:hypothetical protein
VLNRERGEMRVGDKIRILLVSFAFGVGDGFGNIVDADEGLAHMKCFRAKRLAFLRPRGHLPAALAVAPH